MHVLFLPVTTLYAYPRCNTCRDARRWLTSHNITFVEQDIARNPPDVAALRQVLQRSGEPVRRLFNTSGQSYRAGNFASRLATMTDDQALAALASDGMLIKRPLLVHQDTVVIGFQPERYAAVLT